MTASSTLRLVHHGGPFAAAAFAVGFGCSDAVSIGSKKNAVLLYSPLDGATSLGDWSTRGKEDAGEGRKPHPLRQGLNTPHATANKVPSVDALLTERLRAGWSNGASSQMQHMLPSRSLWENKLATFPGLNLHHEVATSLSTNPVLSLATCSVNKNDPNPAFAHFFSDHKRAFTHQEASTSGSGPGLGSGAGSHTPVFSFHSWHLPVPGNFSEADSSPPTATSPSKPPLVVVILGWLGSKQKHLKKYAEWYTEQGIHCVTFTIPMSSVLSVGKGGKAEEHIDELVSEIKRWVVEINQGDGGEEHAVMFHTFSNTGWLMYGAVLERLHQEKSGLLGKIKGCVVDSAPVVDPDPQVWASGFAAALLGKRSSAMRYDDLVPGKVVAQPAGLPDPLQQRQTHATMREVFLHSALEKFFSIFLQLPVIRKRLAEVTTILAEKQPASPQLYIYSTADKVIPVRYVESFIEKQKKQGRSVWSKNMEHSPHVDHFRANPAEYTQHLREFLEKCIPHVDGKGQGGHMETAPVAEV